MVLPLILKYLSQERIALWYLLITIIALEMLADVWLLAVFIKTMRLCFLTKVFENIHCNLY
jgi:hypothetical protein